MQHGAVQINLLRACNEMLLSHLRLQMNAWYALYCTYCTYLYLVLESNNVESAPSRMPICRFLLSGVGGPRRRCLKAVLVSGVNYGRTLQSTCPQRFAGGRITNPDTIAQRVLKETCPAD